MNNLKDKKNNLRHFAPALAWLVFITVLSVMPGVQLPKFNLFAADKLAHAIVYGILVWLVLRGQKRATGQGQTRFWPHGIAAFALSTSYGAFMEWVQGTFFPGRFFEFDDMLANALGAALGLAGWHLNAREGRSL